MDGVLRAHFGCRLGLQLWGYKFCLYQTVWNKLWQQRQSWRLVPSLLSCLFEFIPSSLYWNLKMKCILLPLLIVSKLKSTSNPTLWDPMDCSQPGSSVHRDFPGKNTGLGCHFLLQGIFPTQGLNLVSFLAGRFFTTEPPGKPVKIINFTKTVWFSSCLNCRFCRCCHFIKIHVLVIGQLYT